VETKPCVRCGVEINAASTLCTLCGSRQRSVGGRPGWRTRWLVAGAALVAIVVAVVAVVGGGSKSGGTRFRLFQTSALTTLVPVGWTGREESERAGTIKAFFEEPIQPDYQLSVAAARPARGTAASRAKDLRRQASTRLGFSEQYFGRILFPGGRPAWLLAYESDGFAHALYVYTACEPGVAMSVEVSAPERSELEGLAEPVAASAAPQCG
jgi:hypothetical protein